MFTPLVRLLLIGLNTAVGILALPRYPMLAAGLCLSSALFVLGYFRHGTVWLAFRAIRKGQVDRADSLIRRTHNPSWLDARQRTYYELLKGALAGERGDLEAAETHLRAALAGKLRTGNDIGVAKLTLAEVLLHRGDRDSAKALLEEVQAEPADSGLQAHSNRVEEQIRTSQSL